jgi:hypothetical protein
VKSLINRDISVYGTLKKQWAEMDQFMKLWKT